MATQGGLNGPLARHIGAQTHVGEHVQALDVIAGAALVTRHHQPTGAITTGAVALGERVEGQGQHVFAERCDRCVPGAVVQHLVVDLVGKDHQTKLTGDFHNRHQQRVGIERAGRVVGVNHHDALGVRCDLGAYVLEIGHPAVGLVTAVVHRRTTRQAGRSRPQRIVGHGQQQLVAVVQQAIGCHHDQFGRTIAQINIVQRHAQNALLLGFVHHRLARRKNALAVGVARRIGQVANHVLLNFFRRIKAKYRQIADIELDDFLAFLLHLTRTVHDGAADVVADVGQLG